MTLKELQDRRNELAAQIRAKAETQATWTDEDRTEWERLNKAYDENAAAMAAEQQRLASSEAVQQRLAEIDQHSRSTLNDSRVGLDEGERRAHNPERQLASQIDARALAVQAWLRAGHDMELTAEQRQACRAIGVNPGARELVLDTRGDYGPPSWCSQGRQGMREFRVGLDVANSGAGQETIAQGFVAELERRMLAYANVRQVCRVVRTAGGNALPWPTVDDTSNTGELLTEATSFGTSVDPTFAAVTFNAFKLSSKPVFVSQELLEDSAFNLGSEIASLLGERLGRVEATYTTTGTGSSQPKGIVACAGTGVTSGSATVITADEILGLVHSLNPAYREMNCGFMMHDTALLYVRKLKDANGAYLWMPGLQAGVPDRLIGYPVAINQQMEPLVSNLPVTAKKHVLFGAFEKFIIRDVAQTRFYRLEERYRDTDQTAFVAFRRMDSDTIQANALKVLLQA